MPPPPRTPETQLPWDEQAERAVLGAVLLDPFALTQAMQLLTPSDFYREAHQRIFSAFLALGTRSRAIDAITVRTELEQEGHLERVGGAAYLASLIDGLPRVANIASYAETVRDRSMLRQMLRVAEELRETATSARLPALEILAKTGNQIFDIGNKGRRGGFVPIAEIAHEGLQKVEEMVDRRELITGLPTGYPALDRKTSGFQRGDLMILAARPAMGKTSLALNIAQHIAVGGHGTVGVFSLEMSSQQLFMRLLCGQARVNAHALRTGRLEPGDWERITDAYEVLAKSPMFIDDTPGITPVELRTKAQRLQARQGLDFLVVDYLQLMRYDRRTDSRQQEISEISRSMKGIAKELQIPVLALSQLSRAPEQRVGDHRPQLSDLRESGAIEQDADLVMFIFRPEVYEKDREKVVEKQLEGVADLIIAKQRNGPTGVVPLYFIKQYTRFENSERPTYDDE